LEGGRRKREATLRRLSFEGHKTFIPTVVAVLSSPDILWSITKDMVKKVNTCNQILGKPEQQGIADHSTSKLVPHPQLLFALGLPTTLNWLPINSATCSQRRKVPRQYQTASVHPTPGMRQPAILKDSWRCSIWLQHANIRLNLNLIRN
jgi:hypothetical protein